MQSWEKLYNEANWVRQYEAKRLYEKGSSYHEIGIEFDVSIATVKQWIKSVERRDKRIASDAANLDNLPIHRGVGWKVYERLERAGIRYRKDGFILCVEDLATYGGSVIVPGHENDNLRTTAPSPYLLPLSAVNAVRQWLGFPPFVIKKKQAAPPSAKQIERSVRLLEAVGYKVAIKRDLDHHHKGKKS